MRLKNVRFLALTISLSLLSCLLYLSDIYFTAQAQAVQDLDLHPIRRVLLLSVDGMHALDLANYIKLNPGSTLARLSGIGVTYTNASTSKPSDSFPGLLSIVTGGSPLSTGIFYDEVYDRSLSPPGSKCATVGTKVFLDASIDIDPTALDGGGGLDPEKLPMDLDPYEGCVPAYPHDLLHVNTIFEVIKAAGLRTAWSDKHLSYEILHGPSGHGVDDLFTPEIEAIERPRTLARVKAYDDLKVQAVLHWIDGKDHTGKQTVGVPAIFGMNFQAVNFAQKLEGAGYTDSRGTPSKPLLDALNHTDQSIGKMVDKLRARGLLFSTLIIMTAKHGQAPIDSSKRQIISNTTIPNLVNSVKGGLLAMATQDDIALVWLTDQGQTERVVEELRTNQDELGIQEILSGEAIKLRFSDPLKDPRVPDILVIPNLGVIYADADSSKIAEHGGFSEQDTSVPILVANPRLKRNHIKTPVQTTQIAPTILKMLGLDPQALKAVRIEKTGVLPGLRLSGREDD